MFSLLVLLLITFVGTAFFLFAPGAYWLLGAIILLVTWFGYLMFVFPRKPVSSRGAWAFTGWFMLAAVIIASAVTWGMQANDLHFRLQIESLGSLAYLTDRLFAAIVGAGLGFVLTLIFFVMVGYFSSIYVLALHEEDMSFFTAFKSFIFLIFNFSLAWLVVEDGKVIEVKKQGFTSQWLSRGKIFVKPGMAIVTDRGGKITGIHGPGVIFTQKNERIRTAFDLRPQFAIQTVENVITADQIPITIELGVGYKITPFSEETDDANKADRNLGKRFFQWLKATLSGFRRKTPTTNASLGANGNGDKHTNGNDVTKANGNGDKGANGNRDDAKNSNGEKSENGKPSNDASQTPAPEKKKCKRIIMEKNYKVFPVCEETLMRAAFNVTPGGWEGFCKGGPVTLLRDQIMAHTLTELFTISKTVDLSLKVEERRISQIEKTIKDALNKFDNQNFGVTITGIDIRQINLPPDVREAVRTRLIAAAEADAIKSIEDKRNVTRSELVTGILKAISTETGKKVGENELDLATEFARISRRALTDDVLGHQYIEMLKGMSTGDATKIFNVTPEPIHIEPGHLPDRENGRGNGNHS